MSKSKKQPQLPAHGLMPALSFVQRKFSEEKNIAGILQINPYERSIPTTKIILVSLGKVFPVVLYGYKLDVKFHTTYGEYRVVVSPSLSKSRHVNLGLEGLELVPGFEKDEHKDRFPWCKLNDYFGSGSQVWQEYERRRLCEQAEKSARYAQQAVYRYLAQVPFMKD